jgi:hypothetical protein
MNATALVMNLTALVMNAIPFVRHPAAIQERPQPGWMGRPLTAASGESTIASARAGQRTGAMPTISRFFGIVIRRYYQDHRPPHFHALYGDEEATVEIATLALLEGALPRRAFALVLEWAVLHRSELAADWDRAERREPLLPIPPLE